MDHELTLEHRPCVRGRPRLEHALSESVQTSYLAAALHLDCGMASKFLRRSDRLASAVIHAMTLSPHKRGHESPGLDVTRAHLPGAPANGHQTKFNCLRFEGKAGAAIRRRCLFAPNHGIISCLGRRG